eukprot:jgi/Botrbrau1/18211/Bobra.53_1s0070.1
MIAWFKSPWSLCNKASASACNPPNVSKRRLGRPQAVADATARQHSESACLDRRAAAPPGTK